QLFFTFSTFSAKKKQDLVSQADDPCHNTPIGDQKTMHTRDNSQCLKETLACSEEEQLDFRSISCFKGLSAEPLHLILQENNGSCSQLMPDLRYQDALAKGSFLIAECIDFLETMERKGLLDMDKISCCLLGAFQVMLLIKEAALKPDCKLYTTLISTCAKSGKVDAMFEVCFPSPLSWKLQS
ncbi:hypothetical protein BHE74_00040460, partial [Ensete ventricosum]